MNGSGTGDFKFRRNQGNGGARGIGRFDNGGGQRIDIYLDGDMNMMQCNSLLGNSSSSSESESD